MKMVGGAVGVAHNGGGVCSQPLALLHSSMPVHSLFLGSLHIRTQPPHCLYTGCHTSLLLHSHFSHTWYHTTTSLLSLTSRQHVPLTALVSAHIPAFEFSAQGPSLSSPALYALPGEKQSLPVHDE